MQIGMDKEQWDKYQKVRAKIWDSFYPLIVDHSWEAVFNCTVDVLTLMIKMEAEYAECDYQQVLEDVIKTFKTNIKLIGSKNIKEKLTWTKN